MPINWRGVITLVVGSLISGYVGLASTNAYADTSTVKRPTTHKVATAHADAGTVTKHSLSKNGKAHYASAPGISCVPFARAASGIALKGNAVNWWDAAAGIYQRGNRPEAGAVLNFRANGHMRLGHVAVVTNVVSDRELEIDHANWSGLGASKGGISRGVRVIDVSGNNDWTAVRVALGHSDEFGSVYSTYGFIYDRPDTGRMVANNRPELVPVSDRALLNEVAEAPAAPTISPATLQVDAPDHSLR
jgi:surface antigen